MFGAGKLIGETKSTTRLQVARSAVDLYDWLFFAEGLQCFEVVLGQADVEASPVDN